MKEETVLDAVLRSITNAAEYNSDDAVCPVAVLWPDEKKEWERIVPRLREAIPHFFVFGPYDKDNRSGPAIWLRCVLSGQIPDVQIPKGAIPVLYLPGVSRSTLRATEECPAELKPLAELQDRGVFWSQVNGKDWTVAAFMQTNHGGLKLKIPKDTATAQSLKRAIDRVMEVPTEYLRSKAAVGELNSAYFDSLISDDFVDDLLTWLSDSKGVRERWDIARWETLCSRCISDYGFDPARDGDVDGAEKLGIQERPIWKSVWKRFCSSPQRYPGLGDVLRRAKPSGKGGDLFAKMLIESWPQDNEAAEANLRDALLAIPSKSLEQARDHIHKLESEHSGRRDWVWALLGKAPVASALKHLAILADLTSSPLAASTVEEMAKAYAENGWRSDAAVLDGIASTTNVADSDAINGVIQHLYAPWLRDAAELFQDRTKSTPIPGRTLSRLGEVSNSTCVVFVDGLRMDVGQKLRVALRAKFGEVSMEHHLVAMPSVTPTAKPGVSPVAHLINGTVAGDEFRPCVAETGKDLTIDRFRGLLEKDGYQILTGNEVGDPSGRAWAEFGSLDSTGHQEGIGLARRISELIHVLTQRVDALIAAGWREVRLVTDHGWLLLPGCLPKSDLPKYLTQTRWGRCAVVKLSANVDLPHFDWFWNPAVQVACPRGIDSFIAGQQYNHGGLSVQECVVPQLTVRAIGEPVALASIEDVKWAGLRCKIKVTGDFEGCKVDLRDKPADPSSTLSKPRPIGKDGSVAIVVEDESREGSATSLVLVDSVGKVIEKILVTVGE